MQSLHPGRLEIRGTTRFRDCLATVASKVLWPVARFGGQPAAPTRWLSGSDSRVIFSGSRSGALTIPRSLWPRSPAYSSPSASYDGN